MQKNHNGRSLKCIALMLALLMLAGMFSACGKKDSDKDTTTGSKTTQKATQGKTTGKTTAKSSTKSTTGISTQDENGNDTDPGSDVGDNGDVPGGDGDNGGDEDQNGDNGDIEEEPIDLGGKVIKIRLPAESWSPKYPEFSDFNKAIHEKLLELQAKYNFTVETEFLAGAQPKIIEDLTNYTLAGLYMYDLFLVTPNLIIPEKLQLVTPFGDYVDFRRDPLLDTPPNRAAIWEGKYYGLAPQDYFTPIFGVTYNKDIFQQEGLPDLYELQERNEWTWNKMLDIAITATRDFNGDGIIDQWGLDNSINSFFRECLMLSNGGDIVMKDGDTYTSALGNPNALKAMQFLSDLVNVYKVMPLRSATNEIFDFPFIQGKAAMLFVNIILNRWINVKQAMVHYPMGPDADRYMANCGGNTMYWISSLCEVPSEVARIFAELYRWDTNDLRTSFSQIDREIDNLYSAAVFKDDNDGAWFKRAAQESVTPYHALFDTTVGTFQNMVNEAIITNTPITTIADQYKQQIQDILNAELGK